MNIIVPYLLFFLFEGLMDVNATTKLLEKQQETPLLVHFMDKLILDSVTLSVDHIVSAINHGYNVDALDETGRTLLHVACKRKLFSEAKALLDSGQLD